MFHLDIQVPLDNCARLPITLTTAGVELFTQNEETSSNVYTCMPFNYSFTKKDYQTYVEMCDKDIFVLFPPVIPIENVSPSALRKQQLVADIACTFFHASFPRIIF